MHGKRMANAWQPHGNRNAPQDLTRRQWILQGRPGSSAPVSLVELHEATRDFGALTRALENYLIAQSRQRVITWYSLGYIAGQANHLKRMGLAVPGAVSEIIYDALATLEASLAGKDFIDHDLLPASVTNIWLVVKASQSLIALCPAALDNTMEQTVNIRIAFDAHEGLENIAEFNSLNKTPQQQGQLKSVELCQKMATGIRILDAVWSTLFNVVS